MSNWKTTVSGILAGIIIILAFLASQPFTNGELAMIVPAEWKPYLALASITAAGILAVLRGLASADASSVNILQDEVKQLQDKLKQLTNPADPKN